MRLRAPCNNYDAGRFAALAVTVEGAADRIEVGVIELQGGGYGQRSNNELIMGLKNSSDITTVTQW